MSNPSDNHDALWAQTATNVVGLLKTRQVSETEVLDSLEARISAVDPIVNALPTLCFDRAHAASALRQSGAIPNQDILCGLPVAIKDSVPVANVRCTYGSLVFKDNVASVSDAVVEQIEAHGGLIFAKSNTPEFEAGANTFNEVFGTTRNPWNTDWSAGGSSGGAAVSVATGMAWLAQGTDFACSLRNPASFCGVVGLRPSLGIVPQGPNNVPFQTLSVSGPIARNVADCGLFLEAMSGASQNDPYSHSSGRKNYAAAANTPMRPQRLTYSATLGLTPIDAEVRDICFKAATLLAADGVDVADQAPDMSDAHSSFRTLRALQFASAWGHLLPDHSDLLKHDVIWNIEEGQRLRAEDIILAERARKRMRDDLLSVMAQHGFMVLPTSIVPPYPLTQRYVEECDGHQFGNYLEWMAIAYAISLTGCPAISIPCGITTKGQPVGLQIVAPPGKDAKLLSVAAYAEHVFGQVLTRPITPKS